MSKPSKVFNRTALVQSMTTTIADSLLAFDAADHGFNVDKAERSFMLLTAIETARTQCGKDTGAYLGVIETVLGDTQKGNTKGRIVGTVWENLAGVVTNKRALSSAISKAKSVANWYADASHVIRATPTTFFPLNTLIDIINGRRDAKGVPVKRTAETGTAEVTPASIAVTIKAWCKAGMAAEVAATFATELKRNKDKAIAAVGAAMVDVADELESATGG